MKWFLFNWIHPFQKRTGETFLAEERSFMKAWAVIYPILLYYVAGSICIMLFAYASDINRGCPTTTFF